MKHRPGFVCHRACKECWREFAPVKRRAMPTRAMRAPALKDRKRFTRDDPRKPHEKGKVYAK